MGIYMDIRESIQARVEEARRKKQEKPEVCSHEWQKFKETIRPSDRTEEQMKLGMVYKGGPAHFITYGCAKCKAKRRSDLVVSNLTTGVV